MTQDPRSILVAGVILAAGQSTRMGRAKALLTIPGTRTTFVAHLVEVLFEGGVADVLVVGRPDDEPLRHEVDRLPVHARFVPNPRAETGQLSSVMAGLNAADRPGLHAIVVAPVDLPLVKASTIRSLLGAFAATLPAIARPRHEGQHGHPVVFGRVVFDALRQADPAVGAKAVVHSHPVLNVDVDDPGILRDVDTPGDYAALSSLRI
jgi:molybdenum cofactor cytidylyltransferase